MNAAIEQARQAATDAANATEEAMQKIEKVHRAWEWLGLEVTEG